MVIYHGTKKKIDSNKSKSCLLKTYPDFPTIIALDGVQTITFLIQECGNKQTRLIPSRIGFKKKNISFSHSYTSTN